MNSHFELPIKIDVKISPVFSGAFIVIHIGAIVLMWLSELDVTARYFLTVVILINLVYVIWTWSLQLNPVSPKKIILNSYDEWLLVTASGEIFDVTLKREAFIHPLLVVMSFSGKKKLPAVILTPDVVDPDSLRRLRVRIKYRLTRPGKDEGL